MNSVTTSKFSYSLHENTLTRGNWWC